MYLRVTKKNFSSIKNTINTIVNESNTIINYPFPDEKLNSIAPEVKPLNNSEMKFKSNLYKRKFPSNLIAFSSTKGQKLLKESILLGNAVSFFPTIEQFQTQNHPSYCGPSTMVVNFNSLGIDPLIRWKGPWRWYSEDVISCLKLESVSKHGMTLEEYGLIAQCNGVFNEIFRPDTDINKTNSQIKESLNIRGMALNKSSLDVMNDYININDSKIIEHKHRSNCKKINSIIVKKADYSLFEACVLASCRRDNFNVIINNSRKALNQTGEGHFSPIVAFNNITNHTLLLDVARFKYFSCWLELGLIWDSFFPLDNVIKKPRGFLLTSRFHNLAPEICRKSFDSVASKVIIEQINDILKNYSVCNSLDNFFLILIENLLPELNFKSMVVFYNNDLENRTFIVNCEPIYKNENSQFKIEFLYSKLKPLSDLLFRVILNSNHSEIINILRFYYYLDFTNYIELLTLIIMSLPDKLLNLITNDEFSHLRTKILHDEFMSKEIRTIRRIFGF